MIVSSIFLFLYFRVLDVALKKQIARILTPNHSYNPPEIWEYYDYDIDDDCIEYSPFWPKIFTTSEYVIIHAKLANQKFKTVLEIYKLEEIRHTKVDICKPHKTIQVVSNLADKLAFLTFWTKIRFKFQLPKGAIDSTNVFVDETKIVLIEECKETNDFCIVSRIIDFS
jgi:hypothetical protein